MNRYLFAQVCAVFLILFAAAEADACRRCGRFGNACSFAVHHAPVHHAPAAPDVTNFIFNNSFPGFPLPGAGASVFGYSSPAGPAGFSLASQGQYVDPAMVLNRLAMLAELQTNGAHAATSQFKELGAQALALNESTGKIAIAQVAIAAMQTPPEFKASALKVSVDGNGKTDVNWVTPENEIKPLGNVDISLSCAKCHNKPIESAPGGFFFDGKGMTRDEFEWAEEAVHAGKMPPNSKLDRKGKSQVVEKLRAMVK